MGVFVMPSLGADMEEGKLVEWLVKPGDTVARGDAVAVVETQKGAIEIEVFEAGEVAALEALEGQTLPVGAPMARIRTAGEAGVDPPETPPENPPTAPVEIPPEAPDAPIDVPGPEIPVAPPVEAPDAPPPEMPPDAGQGGMALAPPRASPAARMRAKATGVTLALLHGTGPGGAIVLADVDRYMANAPDRRPDQPSGPPVDMGAMRKAISAAMVRSKREIPHCHLSQSIDLQPATDWLAATNAARAPDGRLLMARSFCWQQHLRWQKPRN